MKFIENLCIYLDGINEEGKELFAHSRVENVFLLL